MSRKAKIIITISSLAGILGAVFLFGIFYHPAKKLEVDFLDVGQGDAILIKAPDGQNILIDGGPNSRVVERLSAVLMPWDKKIDLMILTHPHDDHVSGLVNVIERFEVGRILYTGVSHDSPNYIAWLAAVKKKKIPMTIIDRPRTIGLGENCEMEILYPVESFLDKTVENLNNTSIVVRLVYNETSFLFTGDAEENVEKELLEYQKTPQNAEYSDGGGEQGSRTPSDKSRTGILSGNGISADALLSSSSRRQDNYNINLETGQNKNTIIEKDGVFVDPSEDEVSFPDKYLHNSILENPVKGLGKVNVLKVGHHGSDTSSSEEFLKAVSPEMAVISVGKDNDFGHPSLRTIKKLERIGAKIFRTDEKGTVKMASDGARVEILR